MSYYGKPADSYTGIHTALVRRYGNAPLCIWDESHTSRFEWANVTDGYTTDIEDYLPMCASCHKKFDYTEDQREKIGSRSVANNYASKGFVYQLDSNSIVVGQYESTYDAERQTGILHSSIANNLAGRSKLAGGYAWTRKLS